MLPRDGTLPNSNVISALPLLAEGILVGGDGGALLLLSLTIDMFADGVALDPLRPFDDIHFLELFMT
jgi:hypothetical protein